MFQHKTHKLEDLLRPLCTMSLLYRISPEYLVEESLIPLGSWCNLAEQPKTKPFSLFFYSLLCFPDQTRPASDSDYSGVIIPVTILQVIVPNNV